MTGLLFFLIGFAVALLIIVVVFTVVFLFCE